MITFTCKNCNKVSERRKSTSDSHTFCSRACSNKYRRGQPSWNNGIKLPNRSGINHHFWNKKRPHMQGKNNPNWKGGVSAANQNARLGQKLKHWRKAVFYKDNYICQVCGAYGVSLHADHIESWANYPELRYDISNGRTLCVPCHYYVTFKKKMPEGITWGAHPGRRIKKL